MGSTYLQDFVNLLFPSICEACGASLYKNETIICTRCLFHLPKTNFHTYAENPVEALFWGRIEIQLATAFFFFAKESRLQNLIHKLKYEGKKEIGYELGMYLGGILKNSDFDLVDLVVPIPLHYKKEKKRGYNQSEYIASGISRTMNKHMMPKVVERPFPSLSQTRKSRYERWKNVEKVFMVKDPVALEGKHVLLVDDVLTTGATIEACAAKILEVPGTRVSVAVLGVA